MRWLKMTSNVFAYYLDVPRFTICEDQAIIWRGVQGFTNIGLQELYEKDYFSVVSSLKVVGCWDAVMSRPLKEGTMTSGNNITYEPHMVERVYVLDPQLYKIDIYIVESKDDILESPYCDATHWNGNSRFRKVYELTKSDDYTPDFEAIEQYIEDLCNLNVINAEVPNVPVFHYTVKFMTDVKPDMIKLKLEAIGLADARVECTDISDHVCTGELPY